MPECYTSAAPDVWPGSFMSACSGTVLPLSFTEEVRTLEGVSVAQNANTKRLKDNCYVYCLLVAETPTNMQSVSQGRVCSILHCHTEIEIAGQISRVPDQKDVSLLYIMLEIHHSGREPSNFAL